MSEYVYRVETTWWGEQAADPRGGIERGENFRWFAPHADGPPQVT